MNPGVAKEQGLDLAVLVDRSPVPQKDNGASEMSKEVSKETKHLQAREVFGVEPDIQSHSPSFGRYPKGIDGGDTILPVEMAKQGCVAFRCPCAFEIRDKQEAAFIEENQMGPKFLGFFLSGAICSSSSVRWSPGPSVRPDALVSGSSNPDSSEVSRHGRDDTGHRNVSRSTWRCAQESTGLCCNRLPGGLSKATSPVSFSGTLRALEDDPVWGQALVLSDPSSCSSATTETRSSRKNSGLGLLPTDSCHFLAAGWHVGAASPAAVGFPGVSYPI